MFIGTGLDVEALRARLDTCLLDEEEWSRPEKWGSLEDPFPAVELEEVSPEVERSKGVWP